MIVQKGRRLQFAYYDEPTWVLLALIAIELFVVICLLGVLMFK